MLTSISPIDGRYAKQTQPLSPIFSEMGLMQKRIIVETEYLIALCELNLPHLRKLSAKEKSLLKKLQDLSVKDAQIISDIERTGHKRIPATNHDVKAVEYYIKLKLASTSLKDVLEWVHFGLTSYDVNTPARGLMLNDGIKTIMPLLNELVFSLTSLSLRYKNLSMLARTHGQPASPTTFGKEIRVFKERLKKQIDTLKNCKISAKLNGASGNYNAHYAAYPKINWIKFSEKFIKRLNLEPNLYTTQIDPHDSEAEIFDCLRRINTILIDFNQDIWRYISEGWIKQKTVAGEVGSSAMPHKVNPINFENAEGNLGLANALFEFFSRKLPVSRLQRDLSDSTVERNFGVALGHSLVAYKYIIKGLGKIAPDKEAMLEALQKHPEVLAEAIQTVLRREGAKMPYEKLKELTRGEKVTLSDIHRFIDRLDVSEKVKKELKSFTPETYTGLAAKLADF